MLINNKWNWRDAGIMYEADAGGAGSGGSEQEGEQTAKVEMTVAEAIAELEKTKAALKLANREAAERRKKLDEIETASKAKQDAELTETQKAAKRADDAEKKLADTQQRYRTNAIKNAVQVAARDAGFVDADDAMKLADLSLVELDETSDTVIGAKEAIAALAKSKPHLLKTDRPSPPNINSGTGSGGVPRAPSVDEVVNAKRASGQYVPM